MKKDKTKICVICKKTMVNVASNRAYCDDCMKLSETVKKKARQQREASIMQAQPKHESIDSILMKASEKGLSYGQYMAKHWGA